MYTEYPHFFVENAALILSVGGFLIGFIFGAIVIATNFCTMGAIADIVMLGDYRRFRSWVLAATVALIGTQALAAAGFLPINQSIYLRGGLHWFGSIAGGMIFGFGMVLAGGCPSRNIARAGAGDMRAMTIILVVALFAHIAMGGFLAPARLLAASYTTLVMPDSIPPSLVDISAYATGFGTVGEVRFVLALTMVAAGLVYCFGSRSFRASPRHVAAGIAIGLCVVAGWVTTKLAQDDFAIIAITPVSLTFVWPLAESMDYATRYTGMISVDFGVCVVAGVFTGALALSLLTRRFRLQGFAGNGDTGRNLAGAALMGMGGVFALGCSIGQGVTGISTMAVDSFLAFGAMAAGAGIGVRYMESRV